MPKTLIKNTLIYIITNFFTQGLIFLLWILLAWWLAPAQIGLYALAIFIIELFSSISLFGLNAVVSRFYWSEKGVPSVLNNSLVIFLCASIVSLFLFSIVAGLVPFLIPGLSNILKENLILFLAIIFTSSLANFAIAHYTALKNAIFYTKLQLIKGLFFCLFSLILVYFGFGILGIFYGLLFSSLLVIILFVKKEQKTISWGEISFENMKGLIYYGFPLMLYASFGVINNYFSRILLGKYVNLATLGVYSFFLIFTLQADGLWSTFNRAWTPEIFSNFLKNKEKTLEKIKFMAFFSSFIYLFFFVLLIILGELFLFKLIFKEIYLSNIHLFYILLLGPLFNGVYTAAYPLYYYENKTKIILLISILTMILNLIFTFFMVKFWGEIGAALSFFSISIISSLSYLIAFKKIAGVPKEIINWAFFLSGFMILSVAIFLKTSSIILFLSFLILGVILAYKLGNLSEKKYLFLTLLKKNS